MCHLHCNTVAELAEALNPLYKALGVAATYEDCSRCCGEGKLWLHMNVKNGVCFKCNGSKRAPKNKAAKAKRQIWKQLQGLIHFNKRYRVIDDVTKFPEFKVILKTVQSLPKKYTGLIST